MPETPAKILLDQIPDADVVRERLAENQREAAILRGLLKVSERKVKHMSLTSNEHGRQGGDDAAQ